MKTSRYIQNFYCYQPQRDQPDIMLPKAKKVIIVQKRDKNERSPLFGQKIG
ncbi:hypothetical protein P296_18235 [Salmonella enterica subsp. arizonae serovar 18:z4,z23:- str. CVM N26624]|uniref:Uncharacterized protein n=2 Tax=Salmonella enterica subsp. arizonae TaxID=59203 RepID=A9MNY2_SALAR|nr:hypothetical protein SARI_04282 [Salmonella enterica subsp. arizonae serovar 62:z4,z23:-]AIP98111.1 hypothetical protein N898_19985 [Salmonella enterica subsp. arizonae serovar 62:z36:- str. RKS2983]OLV92409.1 hypothetical protein P297_08780 [Salmonella enterica subsp. arizonae serovar 18:z4,z23:- str. CVM N26625]OLV97423.1 hypothetical protein P296_18235 [Salmonella enterica subsp. arizonae serovar 18:z4,z23:- str. CVM N26624]OLW03803.1 hypothetical protein P298_08230 [Salmonella enterica s